MRTRFKHDTLKQIRGEEYLRQAQQMRFDWWIKFQRSNGRKLGKVILAARKGFTRLFDLIRL